jgi:hypothetical protein
MYEVVLLSANDRGIVIQLGQRVREERERERERRRRQQRGVVVFLS